MDAVAAATMARSLMNEHGLGHWIFEWSRAVRQFGVCHSRIQTIRLSRPLVELNDEARVRRTILHEIAHAKAGAGAAHGPRWQAQCRVLGIEPERCYSTENTVVPPAKYRLFCNSACGWQCERNRVAGFIERGHGRCPRCRSVVGWRRSADAMVAAGAVA